MESTHTHKFIDVDWHGGPHDGDSQMIPRHIELPDLRTCKCHGATYHAHKHEGTWRLEFMHFAR